uniref:Metalloendopeptidase n=1 Tax=Podarcis muralis TaxID=64176 RepID=A0A670IPQ0_PODMU
MPGGQRGNHPSLIAGLLPLTFTVIFISELLTACPSRNILCPFCASLHFFPGAATAELAKCSYSEEKDSALSILTLLLPVFLLFLPDESSVKILKGAFEDFSKFTCIQFVPYSNQRDFIAIAPLSGCFSSVGRIGGMQVVSLAPACLRKGKGVALHELMHVVGFWHEHSRADRDKYISISWDEILTGFEINFMKSWNTNMLVDYDYASVMHYGRNAFSMSGSPTITPLSSSLTLLGQRWNLSNSDVARVNKLYKCSQAAAQPGKRMKTQQSLVSQILYFEHICVVQLSFPCPKGVVGVSFLSFSKSAHQRSVLCSLPGCL